MEREKNSSKKSEPLGLLVKGYACIVLLIRFQPFFPPDYSNFSDGVQSPSQQD